ncbi:MAG TPA: hypothetical protein VKU84_09035, partial [Stellaceae bacterium]|nr:hypothetical protein [Stellaceae bacterium]
ESRGLTLKPGEVVNDTQKVTLQRGDELTLVDESGAVIKLRGPYDGPPTAGGGSGVDISNVVAALGTGGSQSAMGVVRAKVDDVTLPDPWVIDVTHSGKACVRPGTAIVFWRQQSAGPAKLRIMPVDRTWRAESEWPAGTSELPAPTIFPITDRQTYVFDVGGQTATVTLVHVPASLATDRMRAAWMLQKNCLNQTKALIAVMK